MPTKTLDEAELLAQYPQAAKLLREHAEGLRTQAIRWELLAAAINAEGNWIDSTFVGYDTQNFQINRIELAAECSGGNWQIASVRLIRRSKSWSTP